MGNALVTLLNEALTKAEELEKTNKQLEENLNSVNLENWQLKQEIQKLKADIERWKTVTFKAQPK